MKKCIKCGELLEESCFPTSFTNSSGLSGQCKKCTAIYMKERRRRMKVENPLEYEKHLEGERNRVKGLKQKQPKEKRKEYHKRYAQRNKHKMECQRMVHKAISDGVLIKQPCLFCKNPDSQAHHEDYSKPLEIIWLCKSHHYERHVVLRRCSRLGIPIPSIK
jgi:hypothetical protein